MKTKNILKLPSSFKQILWSYNFSKIRTKPEENIETIIINTINNGDWDHWQWLVNNYGEIKIKEIVKKTPQSEFRKGSFRLISLLLNIKKTKYASRGIRIRSKTNI